MKVKDVAIKWGISERRVRVLCEQGKIHGVALRGRSYLIPADAIKPVDGRTMRGIIIPKQYAALFAKIEAKKAELKNRRPLTLGEAERLQHEFLIEYTYDSNAIEGNALTLQETAMVLEGLTIGQKPLKDHLEAIGHKEAFLYVMELAKGKINLSGKVVKEIHSLVLMDRREDHGVYRRIPVKIMGAFHEPPQPYLVSVQMEELMADFQSTKKSIHTIERASLFHLRFEGIHPFIDGNGRTGRLLLNLDLIQKGYPPINIKFTDRKRYYECFDAYYRDNDASPMINMIAEYIEDRLDRYLEILSIK